MLLHLFWSSGNDDTPRGTFSLNAEKAFDRVEWAFLIHTLKKCGFREGFLKLFKAIYSSPEASVLTNGRMSPFFKLTRSSKQGNPLSPLLFFIFLESLAAALRTDTGFIGVWGGGCEHKLYLYTDDTLLPKLDPGNTFIFK